VKKEFTDYFNEFSNRSFSIDLDTNFSPKYYILKIEKDMKFYKY